MKKYYMTFVDDLEDGECLVQCGKCKEKFVASGVKDKCPYCKVTNYYPKWASW